MLFKRYEPRTIEEMIANREQARSIAAYIKNWKKGQCLMIHGPAGCGKTLAVKLAAREANAELVDSYASDDRSISGMQSIASASSQQSLVRRTKVVLIEDADMIDSAKALSETITKSPCPVIIVAADPYARKLQSVRKFCTLLQFHKARVDSITRLLSAIRDGDKIARSDGEISRVARASGGDVRAALNDLRFSSDARDSTEDIFNTLKIIFKTRRIENVEAALRNSTKPIDDVLLWLEWNVAEEYEKPDEIVRAYDWLSKADIASARIIRRQAWALAKEKNVAVAGVALAKKEMYRKFTHYSFPRIFPKKQSFPLLSQAMHVSSNRLREYSALFSAMKKKRALPDALKEEVEILLE